ncbi:MAG: hypothetical protein ABIK61_03330 [candidate division WOR-3 bacterium]
MHIDTCPFRVFPIKTFFAIVVIVISILISIVWAIIGHFKDKRQNSKEH